jgi:hypothetical protein
MKALVAVLSHLASFGEWLDTHATRQAVLVEYRRCARLNGWRR